MGAYHRLPANCLQCMPGSQHLQAVEALGGERVLSGVLPRVSSRVSSQVSSRVLSGVLPKVILSRVLSWVLSEVLSGVLSGVLWLSPLSSNKQLASAGGRQFQSSPLELFFCLFNRFDLLEILKIASCG